MNVQKVAPPVDCSAILPGYDFADAYAAPVAVGVDAMEAAGGLCGAAALGRRIDGAARPADRALRLETRAIGRLSGHPGLA
jgi:hypothetical protein